MSCDACRELLSGDGGKQFAWTIEEKFPRCECEAHSVGRGSPGVVGDSEIIYRFITNFDEAEGQLSSVIFEKAYRNGLSVFREQASDEDVLNLATDLLTVKQGSLLRHIVGLFRVECVRVRQLATEPLGRLFCVYDQTVPRKFDANLDWVGTHASLFQRIGDKPGTKGREPAMSANNLVLMRELKDRRISVEAFRRGLLLDLNTRSRRGELVRPA